MKLGKQGIAPTRDDIRARRKPESIAPVQCADVLVKRVYEPMKDRAYAEMLKRIDANRLILNGKR